MSKLNDKKIEITQVAAVGIGGIIGALLRYGLSGLFAVGAVGMSTFPYDTLIVNLSGSFLLAFILSFVIKRVNMNKTFLVFLTTGVLGSFTTFSTIIIDVFILFNEQIIFAFIYLIITLLGGLTFALLGLLIGQRI